MASIACVYCHGRHDSAHEVRLCWERWATGQGTTPPKVASARHARPRMRDGHTFPPVDTELHHLISELNPPPEPYQ